MQGEIYGKNGRKTYQRKFDQRELMKVIQRNFRKYQQLRSWGWFIIIHKTKPLIGQVNPEEELRVLEEQANESYGAYQKQLDTKVNYHMMVLTLRNISRRKRYNFTFLGLRKIITCTNI